MKVTHILTAGWMLLAAAGAAAADRNAAAAPAGEAPVLGLTLEQVQLQRQGDLMEVKFDLDLADFELEANRATVFAPMIAGASDTLRLRPVGLYSRTRWYQYLRTGEKPLGGSDETSFRWSELPARYTYAASVPYAEWMNGSQLLLERCDYGCCRLPVADPETAALAGYAEAEPVPFVPAFRYQRPVAAAVKERELSGRAYIDFPVNRTELYPEYRKNPYELSRIIATIDSVRNDADVTVKRITIKGWASPESSWENNTRLAKGRSATLTAYVQQLYKFPAGFIESDYYPEDWEGLRAYVETSNLPHRAEILALIDDPDLDPDPKEWRIKLRYPEEYQILLNEVYPGLRHSDYRIEYTIRQFSDPAEIAKLLRTQPQKLSLDELFLLAQSYEEGSDAYNEVLETAARMFPDDQTANLNAANAAMSRGELEQAANYLAKAGNSPEAIYARGMLAALQGDCRTAQAAVKTAAAAGMAGTEAMQAHLEAVCAHL